MEEIQITVEYLEPGPRGEKGWTALYSDESYIVGGKQRIIKKLTDYVGGQGTKPTEGLGLYLAEDGLFTDDKDLALDYKGIQGEKPGHVWTGTALAIENTDGTMGEAVDLKGDSAYQLWLDAGNVGTMADFLYSLKKDSVDAAALANNAATNANEKAIAAQTSADNANQATQAANTATSNANTAATSANDKASLADTKATLADQKATLANTAAINADSKATAAQTATTNANTATGAANTAATAANNAAAIANAARGWTPVHALVDDGIRTVQKLVDYVGGTGTKPTANINSYVTTTGFSTVISDGKDVRGTAGLAGVSRIPAWTASVYADKSSVLYLGKYWTSNAATLATDIPGTSAKWVEDLTAYNPRNKQIVDFTANRLIIASDNNCLLKGSSETDLNLIIPANATAALPIGFQVLVKQQGAGRIIVVTEQGVTLESPESRVNSNMQFAQFWLIKDGTDRWSLEGSLVKDVLTTFYSQVTSDGGTTDGDLIKQGFNEMDVKFRNQASILLIPGAYKTGKVYGMNPVSGAIIPFNFTRAGTATYFDKNGVLQTAAANMPRIDYDPVTKECKGYLIEGSRTNISLGLSNGIWLGNRALKTNNFGISPDGTNNSVKVTSTIQEAGGQYISQAVTTSGDLSGRTFTFSIWLKSDSDKPISRMYAYGVPGNEDVKSKNITITNQWVRHSLTWTFKAGMLASYFTIRVDLPDSSPVGTYYECFGAQLEESSILTSYIPTTNAQVTRPVEALNTRTNQMSPNPLIMSEATIYAQYDTLFESNFPRLVYMTNGDEISDTGVRGSILSKTTGVMYSFDDPSGVSPGKVAIGYGQGTAARAKNGVIMNQNTIVATPTTDINLSIGSVLGSTNRILFGHIKTVMIAPKRISNSDLQILTT